MPYLPTVIQAEHRGGYRLHLVFSDNTAKTVDLSLWLKGPVFAPLKSVSQFRRFYLDGGSVAWPNGADIAPETLYTAAAAGASRTPKLKAARQPALCR
jgi:hypothetical protein